ncbi:MAG TPA: SDR family oxidoreductase [Candidatus Bathyarchaeia archaeon]|nr:SDR family oxidoreductase [Candidatus Bathyarchaeia archaeon]
MSVTQYLVTGGTGFIGRHLVATLLRRGGTVHLLVDEPSLQHLAGLLAGWDAGDRVRVVRGDVTRSRLGIAEQAFDELRGRIDHFFHLAAVYDMNVDPLTARRVNVEGTRHALDAARTLGVKHFHHVSSIAVAGDFAGRFFEDMLDEGQRLDHPYFESKFLAEKLVRAAGPLPWRIYRPGIVVGHSVTGAIDKIDGPYYLFPLLRRLRDGLPRWAPLVGVEGGILPLVPVDFVVGAMDHLAHAPGLDRRSFHLVDRNAHRAGEALNIFCRAAGAPELRLLGVREIGDLLPGPIRSLLPALPNVPAAGRLWEGMLEDLGVPPSVLAYMSNPTIFDSQQLDRALAGSGISCPPLESYADKLWAYWEQHLAPVSGARHGRSLRGKTIAVTGAASGIGRELAKEIAGRGGVVLLLDRAAEALDALAVEIRAAGGRCHGYAIDLRDFSAVDRVIGEILDEHGGVDALVNNAGHSIRRSIELAQSRFHDYQRTMQINYFAPLRLILGFLPSMRARRSGHVVNISSIGVQAGMPRYSAYIASKAALDAFSSSLAAEVIDEGIAVTTIYMPLVRTPMIAPTSVYRYAPALSPKRAARLIVQALIDRPRVVTTPFGTFAATVRGLVPNLADRVLNVGYRLFPESAAARGERAVAAPAAELRPPPPVRARG